MGPTHFVEFRVVEQQWGRDWHEHNIIRRGWKSGGDGWNVIMDDGSVRTLSHQQVRMVYPIVTDAELDRLRTLAAQAEANAKKWLEVVRITNNRGYTPTEIGWELRKLIREYGELIE